MQMPVRSLQQTLYILIALVFIIIGGSMLHKSDQISKELPQETSRKRAPSYAKSCPEYYELREVDLQQPEISERLCKHRKPPCEITDDIPSELLSRINDTAVRIYIASPVTGGYVTVYTYPAADVASDSALWKHSRETRQAKSTLLIASKFPAGLVTFVDIGCHVGVYALLAREAGLPTVAVDPNLPNVIRVRLAARDMGWVSDPKLKIIWMLFHQSASLQYLKFSLDQCNVGNAAAELRSSITDKIPVMTGRADYLVSSIATKLVVMRISTASSELAFLSTARRLFNDKIVVAVQMQFWRPNVFTQPASATRNFAQIVDFFTKRNYRLFSLTNLTKALDLKSFFDEEAMWIRNDYVGFLHAE